VSLTSGTGINVIVQRNRATLLAVVARRPISKLEVAGLNSSGVAITFLYNLILLKIKK
jgi:hypothetical protein